MNIPNAIINLEVQVELLTYLVEQISRRTNVQITQNEVDAARKRAQQVVINRYPQAGITFGN